MKVLLNYALTRIYAFREEMERYHPGVLARPEAVSRSLTENIWVTQLIALSDVLLHLSESTREPLYR